MSPDTSNRSRLLLPVLFTPIFMVLLDVFIVNVAAPSLQAQLGAGETKIQWIVTAYVLSYALSLITGGRLGDAFGRRRLFVIGVAGFTLSSALCAAAPSPEVLIGARLLQGFTAAAMWPQVLSIIQVEMSAEERPRAFGIQGQVQGAASIAGQIVGGGLIALDAFGLGWRWVFLINVPIGLAALATAGRVVPESRSEGAQHLDLRGIAAATLALLLFLVPVVEGRELGWPWWAFAAIALVPVAAAAFVRIERAVIRAGRRPLVELHLFSSRAFAAGVAGMITLLTITAFFLLLSIYLQDAAGLDALQSGLAFTPLAVAFVAGSRLGSRVPDPVRQRLPQIGALAAATGLLLTTGVVVGDASPSASVELILATIPVGLGMGTAVPATINAVLSLVPVEDAGSGSGVLSTAQQIGNATGIAVIGSIFFGVLGGHPDGLDFGHAFAVGMITQAVLACGAAGLFAFASAARGGQQGSACVPGGGEIAG